MRLNADMVPAISTDFDKLTQKELESMLLQVHQAKAKLKTIFDDYKEGLVWDDEQSKEVAKDRRTAMQMKRTKT